MWIGQASASRLAGSDKKTDSGEKVATQSDISDQRYRTQPDIGTSDIGLKSAESDIISDFGINFSLISDIRHLRA